MYNIGRCIGILIQVRKNPFRKKEKNKKINISSLFDNGIILYHAFMIRKLYYNTK